MKINNLRDDDCPSTIVNSTNISAPQELTFQEISMVSGGFLLSPAVSQMIAQTAKAVDSIIDSFPDFSTPTAEEYGPEPDQGAMHRGW